MQLRMYMHVHGT